MDRLAAIEARITLLIWMTGAQIVILLAVDGLLIYVAAKTGAL